MDSPTIKLATPAHHSRLLTIPGEIRNRIYEIALDGSTDNDPPRSFSARHRTDKWSEIDGAFMGLTQVCHQLRAEFLPIHRARVKIFIYINSLAGYLQDSVFKVYGDISLARGNIVIDMAYRRYSGSPDFRDLMLLCAQAPQFQVVFAESIGVSPLISKTIFHANKWPAWHEYIARKSISIRSNMDWFPHNDWERACIYYNRKDVRIDNLILAVKPEFAKEWMYTYRPNKPTQADLEECHEWRRGLGLDPATPLHPIAEKLVRQNEHIPYPDFERKAGV
ncbi:hypothetical protein EJ07DRAFT_158515 [Lizonia empirigonia]|nr:hypothetical protein EJ07DRAFT_158515 [Lizonia empirigonia]